MMYSKKLTVGVLKELLKRYNVPDDALITCQSDEEGNRETVCDNIYVQKVGHIDRFEYDGKQFEINQGEDVIGFDEEDKGKIFVTFHPMY